MQRLFYKNVRGNLSMRVFQLLLLILFWSCSQRIYTKVGIYNDNLYGDISDGLPDKDSLSFEKKGEKIVGKGFYAVTTDQYLSNIKVGLWKEYNDNGIIKSEGNYKIGYFIDCCAGGFCKAFYYYRSGIWKFYDQMGGLEYEIEFEPAQLHKETSCQGGDTLTFGLIKKIPSKYWDKLTTDKIYELQKITFDDSYQTITYTPLNGRLFIESKRKR